MLHSLDSLVELLNMTSQNLVLLRVPVALLPEQFGKTAYILNGQATLFQAADKLEDNDILFAERTYTAFGAVISGSSPLFS